MRREQERCGSGEERERCCALSIRVEAVCDEVYERVVLLGAQSVHARRVCVPAVRARRSAAVLVEPMLMDSIPPIHNATAMRLLRSQCFVQA